MAQLLYSSYEKRNCIFLIATISLPETCMFIQMYERWRNEREYIPLIWHTSRRQLFDSVSATVFFRIASSSGSNDGTRFVFISCPLKDFLFLGLLLGLSVSLALFYENNKQTHIKDVQCKVKAAEISQQTYRGEQIEESCCKFRNEMLSRRVPRPEIRDPDDYYICRTKVRWHVDVRFRVSWSASRDAGRGWKQAIQNDAGIWTDFQTTRSHTVSTRKCLSRKSKRLGDSEYFKNFLLSTCIKEISVVFLILHSHAESHVWIRQQRSGRLCWDPDNWRTVQPTQGRAPGSARQQGPNHSLVIIPFYSSR